MASIEALPLLASELTVKVREVSPSAASVKVSVPVREESSAPVPVVSTREGASVVQRTKGKSNDLGFFMAVVISDCNRKGIRAVEVLVRCVCPRHHWRR